MAQRTATESTNPDDLAQRLRQLDKRRGLSFKQVLEMVTLSLFLAFVVGPSVVAILGPFFGPSLFSVLSVLVLMFLYEDMRGSNVTRRTGFERAEKEIMDEGQSTLDFP